MKRRVGSALPTITALLALGTCALVPAGVATATPARTVRVGRAPSLPRGAQAVAPVPAAKQLQLTIALKSQDPAGLAAFADEVSAPSSSSFRRYLTVAQFARRFGAPQAQIAAVRSALRAQGLAVGPPTANDLTLPLRGTAAQVQKALSVSLSQVRLSGGRTAYANAQAPAIPASVAPAVQAVIGLDNVRIDQPAQALSRLGRSGESPQRSSGHLGSETPKTRAGGGGQVQLATGGPQPCTEAQALQVPVENGVGQTADQIATAYQFPGLYKAGDFGGGQTIAVFEQEAFRPQDIAAYQACYGTNAAITPVDVDGGPEPYEGEDIEAALDIEQIVGLAPQAHVLVYQGPIEQNVAPVDIISRIVSDDTAKVISSSWGFCEAETELGTPGVISAENTLLQEAAAQGQSFFVASGDSGSEQCSQVEPANESLSVLNPASQPFATGVGGTTLYSVREGEAVFYTGARPPIEGVWNDGPRELGGGGTGGGVSELWGMPSYQSSAAAGVGVINPESSSTPCGLPSPCREVPDVAADADPKTGYIVYFDGDQPLGGWNVVGGTSASAPLWAALTGLANASTACQGVPVGFANPTLYAIAGSGYASNFRDVVEPSPFTEVANNNTLFGEGPFAATHGYDMTTGIGAPIGSTLAASMCSVVNPPPDPTPQPVPTPQPLAAPQTTSPPAGGAPGGGATQGLGASIGVAQIKAQLLAQLSSSGKAAKIASLLRAGGVSLTFTALEPGTVVIDWYELPPGARLAKKLRPVLVAAGHLTLATAGRGTVRLKFTTVGKSLLEHAKRLELTARGTFTPTGKAPVSATKAFALRH